MRPMTERVRNLRENLINFMTPRIVLPTGPFVPLSESAAIANRSRHAADFGVILGEVKTDYGCDPGFSAASNLGPNNAAEIQLIKQRQKAIAAFDHVPISQIPPDAVEASASGLDPGISVANADLQAPRVAQARNLPLDTVLGLVKANTHGPQLGFIGETTVNVVTLNLALNSRG